MNIQENRILIVAAQHTKGLLSPAELINSIAQGNRRAVEMLVTHGYIEEVPQDMPSIGGGHHNLNFYRVTAKGHLVFAPWHRRLWVWVSGDLKTIIVAAITSLVTTTAAILAERILK